MSTVAGTQARMAGMTDAQLDWNICDLHEVLDVQSENPGAKYGDYLDELYALLGEKKRRQTHPHCPACGRPMPEPMPEH